MSLAILEKTSSTESRFDNGEGSAHQTKKKQSSFDRIYSLQIGKDRAQLLEEAFKRINSTSSFLYKKFGIHPMSPAKQDEVLNSEEELGKFTQDPYPYCLNFPSLRSMNTNAKLGSFLVLHSDLDEGELQLLLHPITGKYAITLQGILLGMGDTTDRAFEMANSYLKNLVFSPVNAFFKVRELFRVEMIFKELTSLLSFSPENRRIHSIVLEYLGIK